MRWDELFRDLEGQLVAADCAELAAEVTDRTRRETALVQLADRLRAATGHSLLLLVHGAGRVSGCLLDVGSEWLLLRERPGEQTLVPLPAVMSVVGLGLRAEMPDASARVLARLGLGHALRAVARDRAPVEVVLLDGRTVTGTMDRVGADFCDLAEHPVGEPRRHGRVRAVQTIPFAAIGLVRSG